MTKPKLFGKEIGMSEDGGDQSFWVHHGRVWVWILGEDPSDDSGPARFCIGVGPLSTLFSGRLETRDLATQKAEELLREIRDDLNKLIGD